MLLHTLRKGVSGLASALSCALGLLVSTMACTGGDEERLYRVQFQGTAHEQPFSCSGQFDQIGVGNTTVTPLDFRFWVHDVTLVRASGDEIPLLLKQDQSTSTIADDGAWQKDNVALLDFEDASGSCTGTSETRTQVVGYAPGHKDYQGLKFKVGVPKVHNNVDAPVAAYPFGAPGMSWQWKGGYRFVKLDVTTATKPAYYFHLGSTGCEGDVGGDGSQGGINCSVENVAPVALDGFDPDEDVVLADLATIYSSIDVESDPAYACMSGGTTNTLCPSMFAAFGLTYATSPAPAGQTFFRIK